MARIKLDATDYGRSKSRNVNAYVKAVAARTALKHALAAAEIGVRLAEAKLTGRMRAEAARLMAAGPVVRVVPGTRPTLETVAAALGKVVHIGRGQS